MFNLINRLNPFHTLNRIENKANQVEDRIRALLSEVEEIELGPEDLPPYLHPEVSEDIKEAISKFILKTDFFDCDQEVYNQAYRELEDYLYGDWEDDARCAQASEAIEYMFAPIVEVE